MAADTHDGKEKRASDALRQSEERSSLLVESVKDYAIIVLDPSGCVMSWNQGAERIKGYRSEEIVGKHFSCFYSDEDIEQGKPLRELKRASVDGLFEDEGWRIRKDGSRFWAYVVITALKDETGQLRGFSKVTRDITEHKRAEEEIRKLNAELEDHVVKRTAQLEAANKELEAFIYSVSHDLRAPLRHISGYVELLATRCRTELPEKGRHYLDTIADSAHQMGLLIDDLLRFSRTGHIEMRQSDLDMNRIVHELSEQLCQANPHSNIEWNIGHLPSVYGDYAMLRLVWMNLLSNAVKFTRTREKAKIEVQARDEIKEVVFFVRDNGVGFDMKYAQKLFGVFQRLHSTDEYEGTGIGLANVRRIILRHGGRTWAEAELDKGATIYFSIPK